MQRAITPIFLLMTTGPQGQGTLRLWAKHHKCLSSQSKEDLRRFLFWGCRESPFTCFTANRSFIHSLSRLCPQVEIMPKTSSLLDK